jgi:hypothetical protein
MKGTAPALLLPILLTAASVGAQPRPVPVARWEATVPRAQVRRIRALREYARCLVQYRNVRAEGYLATRPESPEAEAERPRLVAQGNCIWRPSLSIYDFELRGLLSEFVYRRGSMGGPLRARQPFEGSYLAYRAALGGGDSYGTSTARWVALCVVRADPGGVRALLDSDPASPRELERMLALTGPIMRCGEGGPPLTLGRFGMRAVLAEALYRLRG